MSDNLCNGTEILSSFPPELQKLLRKGHFQRDKMGCSNSEIYKVDGLELIDCAYLKVQNSDESDLEREKAVLDWLRGKLPVPEVLYYGQCGGRRYLLISEIKGSNASDPSFSYTESAAAMVRALAQGLRMVHSVDVTGCTFDRRLDVVLSEAQAQVDQGLVDVEDLQPENMGRQPEDILQELLDRRPEEDLTFTHGDYSLPNIVLQDGKVSGFIDLGRAGIADRYIDIALAVRSLKFDMGLENADEMLDLFMKEYGLESLDQDKVAYYILLDELF